MEEARTRRVRDFAMSLNQVLRDYGSGVPAWSTLCDLQQPLTDRFRSGVLSHAELAAFLHHFLPLKTAQSSALALLAP